MAFKKSHISDFKLAMCHIASCIQILFFGIYAYGYAQYANERHYVFEFTYVFFTMTGHYLNFKIGKPKNFKVIRDKSGK